MEYHELKNSVLEPIYARYNKREFVHPDPLEFLYKYREVEDRELAALVASSLAYGRVASILKSVSSVLRQMGDSPRDFVVSAASSQMTKSLGGFRHRFATGEHVVSMLNGARKLIEEYGTLNAAFVAMCSESDATVIPALTRFVDSLSSADAHLVPDPARGSACKRLNLFLRWMVRKDQVDPGGWTGIQPSRLVVPLDTHMARIGVLLGLTSRRTASLKMAMEITAGFRRICPEDPVKYDFALTRYGIRNELDFEDLRECARRSV